jgi:hypothetical protein
MRVGSILAPPTRRELTITLFGLSVFVLSYNLDASLHVVGVDSLTSTTLSTKLGISAPLPLDVDGRRPEAYRDSLEESIFGKWEWPEGSVAEGEGRPPQGEGSRYLEGAILSKELNASGAAIKRKKVHDALRGWGASKLGDEVLDWTGGIPQTSVKAHVAGMYTSFTFFIQIFSIVAR